MSLSQAVIIVVEYIIENELYNFKSLSDSTQKRLIDHYGPTFEEQVNLSLGLN